ncbi:MAG: M24 family metallopeptidase [Bacteroidales bacterium]
MFTTELKTELNIRWDKIRQAMTQQGVDATILTTTVNLIYISGQVFNGYFFLPLHGEPIFFIKRPLGINGENVHYIRKPEDIPSILELKGIKSPKNIAFEADAISYNEQTRLLNIFNPEHTSNASTLLRVVRSIKTPYEIQEYRKTCSRHSQAMAGVASLYKDSMNDLDFSIEIERHFRRSGSLGHFRTFGPNMEIYMGSILAGDNANAASPYDFALGGAGMNPSLPIGCSGEELTPGKAIMVDMGGLYSAYISDMTRVYSIGKLPELAYKAHTTSINIVRAIEKIAKPGTPCADLYNLALEMVKEAGLTKYFMGYDQQAAFIGHGIGIEINELPILFGRSKDILHVGNVFALEPKFVIPKVGAVGIENSYVVTENGIENLTQLQEEIIELPL